MQAVVLINGKQTDTISVTDRGLQYGDGVWETIAIQGNTPQFIEAHLKRLILGCQALHINPPDLSVLKAEIKQLTDTVKKWAILKIIITRGSSGRGYRSDFSIKTRSTRIVSLHPWGDHIAHFRQTGIDLQLCKTRLAYNPPLAGFKHLNRLEQVLGSAELHDDKQEGLMLDFNDIVIEGTMSNVFIVSDNNAIKTPLLNEKTGCGIKGIMRQKVIEWLRKNDYTITEEPFKLEDVLTAQGIFITNSIIGVWAVKSFQDKTYATPDFIPQFNHFLETAL